MASFPKKFEIYTDGSSLGNPGPGGWGVILVKNDKVYTYSGGNKYTTNNRMEMTAVIKALEIIKTKELVIHTDSNYTKQGLEKWIINWKKRNWIKSDGKPVLNKDLWMQLDKLNETYKPEIKYIKAHAGHKYNEMADVLAKSEAKKYLKK